MTYVGCTVINEGCVNPSILIFSKLVVEVCGTICVSTPVRLMEESAVTDTVMDTLARLSEEELVSAEISRLNPCCKSCLLYTSPSPRDVEESRMPSSA